METSNKLTSRNQLRSMHRVQKSLENNIYLKSISMQIHMNRWCDQAAFAYCHKYALYKVYIHQQLWCFFGGNVWFRPIDIKLMYMRELTLKYRVNLNENHKIKEETNLEQTNKIVKPEVIKPGPVLKFKLFKKPKRLREVRDRFGNIVHPNNLTKKNKRIHAGAGVIFVDRKAGEFILIKDKKGYTDAGGRIESLQVVDCAIKESYEETRTLVRLTRSILNNCQKIDYKMYRTYFVEVNGENQPKVKCEDFYKIDVSNMPKDYQETYEMDKFKINDLQRTKTNIICKIQRTTHGKNVELRDRTIAILTNAENILNSF